MIGYQKTLDCGCMIRDYGEGKLRIKYCPKHAAAPDLLETCHQAHRLLKSNIKDGPIPADSTVLNVMVEKMETAIAQATGNG